MNPPSMTPSPGLSAGLPTGNATSRGVPEPYRARHDPVLISCLGFGSLVLVIVPGAVLAESLGLWWWQ